MTYHRFPAIFLCLAFGFLTGGLYGQTTVSKINDRWTLLVDGQPFEVKGATFGYDDDTARYGHHFEELNFLGVNTIRTWGTGEHTARLLDSAHAHGIKVMVGIWMRHGRPGMEADDSFNYLEDTAGKEKMYEDAINTVKAYKDHPAVLCWGVGNEVYLNMATDPEKEVYSKLLEKICSKIKELDPTHLVTSVEAWNFGLDWWKKYVPSLDIYGINTYGAGANFIPEEFEKRDIDKPYVITEFGVTGEWDAPEDTYGVTIEPSDAQKYEAIARGYPDWIRSKAACLGVYVFHYADGKDFVAPWLFTHFRGKTRPQYWAIREAYTGQKPLNHVPVIKTFTLPDYPQESGTWVPVGLEVSDREGDSLSFRFFYNQRTGSRKRRDQLVPLLFKGDQEQGFRILLPEEDGAVKFYVCVTDSYHNAGIATSSCLVTSAEAKARKYLVPKVQLPFYVYKDGDDLPYIPSAHMGNYQAMEVDLNHTGQPHSGRACMKISYSGLGNWYGLGLVDPPNDWGDMLGGYDISGANTFRFWARSSEIMLDAKIGFGLIGKDRPFPDTDQKLIPITLTTEWKEYEIKLKKMDLSCIRSGLVIFSQGNGYPHAIYLDDVVFE